MSQYIYFKTAMFDISKERENPINPILGVSLLDWLRETLAGQIEVTEPDAEDWGWYSELYWQGDIYLIGASTDFEEGDDPHQEREWVFQIEKYRSLKQKLLGKNKMTASDPCFLFFYNLFKNQPGIKALSKEQ